MPRSRYSKISRKPGVHLASLARLWMKLHCLSIIGFLHRLHAYMLASLVVRSSLVRVHLTTAICGKEWRVVFMNVERKLSLFTSAEYFLGLVDRNGKSRFY